jgi:uncharacterized coiled-coil protein SlyX
MNSTSLFDLYTEAQKNYNSIFPKKEEGLVVFLLYQKVRNGVLDKGFSHDNILDAIEFVSESLHGKINKNNSPARDNEIIRVLLDYYLVRTSKGYSLKLFANDLCQLIEGELHHRFQPSQIEKQFILFLDSLKTAIKEEETFGIWYINFFQRSHNQMRKQIEILQNDVERTIRDLNILYSSQDVDFASKLREMDNKVQTLSGDAKKLESAFVYSDNVLETLNEAYADIQSYAHTSDSFQEIRKEIRSFFTEITEALAEVSFTVDGIRPQLERLYHSFDQRELDRKLEKLVNYLFQTARYEKNESGKEELAMPSFMEMPIVASDKTRLQFLIHYDYVNPANPESRDMSFDEEDFNNQYKQMQSKILVNQRAVTYFKEFLIVLAKDKQVNYHEHLFRLLEKEGNLEIAMKASHLILKELSKDPKIKISINPTFQISLYNKNTAIWETKFQNLNS